MKATAGSVPSLEVLVVLIQIDDVAEQLRVVDEARVVQERTQTTCELRSPAPVGGGT